MSSSATFRKIAKSRQKTHKERSQPSGREHLGLLEKKKDYKLRADEHHKKENALKALRIKASARNPNEFYHAMVRTKLEEGVHKRREEKAPEYTPDQLKLFSTQDTRYLNFKRGIELNKIEKLKSSLHLLDVPGRPKNQHTIFVDSKKEVREFDAAKHLDTDPALLDRVYNRPRRSTLASQRMHGALSDTALAEGAAERSRQYTLLSRRIARERELRITAQKLEIAKHLLDKKAKKKKVSDGSVHHAPVYRWVSQRKR